MDTLQELRNEIADALYGISDIYSGIVDGDYDDEIFKLIGILGNGKYNKLKEIQDQEKLLIEIDFRCNQEKNQVLKEISRLKKLGESEIKASRAFGKTIKLK